MKSFVSFKNESLHFWTRVHFKGESQVLQNCEGVALKTGGGDRFIIFFWGGGGVLAR